MVFNLDGLDEHQREAAQFDKGAALVVAGPGSGKTRLITHRIAHLVTSGNRVSSVLAITFANNAAEEMRVRVGRLIKTEPDSLKASVSTFHSLGFRILTRNRAYLPFKLVFQPIDVGTTSRTLRSIASDYKRLGQKIPTKHLRGYISMAKREDVDYSTALEREPDSPYALAYMLYEQEKQKLGLVDFDDMIFLCWRLLRDHPPVLKAEQERCGYLMVDEFHDTDIVQMRIAMALAGAHGNFMAVADSNQAIYGWRGADYRICLNFGDYYPEHQKFFLATNYRSLPPIVGLYKETIDRCPSLIEGFLEKINPFRKQKTETDGLPMVLEFGTDQLEAEWVSDTIAAQRKEGETDTAILYRTNKQACLLEEALFRKQVPYIVQGACSFFNRAEVKDLLAFLRILGNRNDNTALERIVKSTSPCSKYLGTAFLRQLAVDGPSWFNNLYTIRSTKQYQINQARLLHQFIERLDYITDGLSLDGQLTIIAKESGLMGSLMENEMYEESAENDAAENIPQVIRVAAQFKGRADFLSYVERVAAASERQHDTKENPVRLMTVHRSKGLEFSTVFFIGVNDDIVPHRKSHDDPAAVEEEQRIVYVAVSRAMNQLYVSAWDRPSRFLVGRFATSQKIGITTRTAKAQVLS